MEPTTSCGLRAEAQRLGISPTVIADAGHSGQLDNPDALAAALLDFWGRNR